MKNILSLFTVALLVSPLSGQLAVGGGNNPPPSVAVSGQAEVLVAPDLIDIRLGVECRKKELSEALQENSRRVAAIIETCKKFGIEDKDIQTDWLGLEPRYDSDYSKAAPQTYNVQKSVSVTLREPTNFEALITAVVEAGATHVHGIDFRTTKLREYRDQARLMALRAAREKADLLANELGNKRGRALAVNENVWGGWWTMSGGFWGRGYANAMAQNSVQSRSGAESEGGFAAGQIRINATVNASFLLE